MIAYIKGVVEEVTQTSAIIDVGGIGYEILISPDTASRMQGRGEEAKLFTYMYVREDQFALYGFLGKEELELFKQLITVSGIGPKGGLSILSAMSSDDLRFAILAGDAKSISRAPGIGKKTAERLILDLRDKLKMPGEEEEDGGLIHASSAGNGAGNAADSKDVRTEAAEALVALGYSRAEALKAVRTAAAGAPEADTEMILKAALKLML